MAALSVEHISKRFGRRRVALADVSLCLNDGETMAVIGPSGAGKSTLLRVIAGLEREDTGDMLIDGKSVLREAPHRRGVAMVMQRGSLYPHMSVAANLRFPLRTRKPMPRADASALVEAIARDMHISHLLQQRAATLSAGEEQRVALAKALIVEPTVLLLDEPLAHLDPPLRFELREVLRETLRSRSTTCIFVSHDQEDAAVIADRGTVLINGAIHQTAAFDVLHRQPSTRAVAAFIGMPPMQLMQVCVRRCANRIIVRETPSSPSIMQMHSEACDETFHVEQTWTLGIDARELARSLRPPPGAPTQPFVLTITARTRIQGRSAVHLRTPAGQKLTALLADEHGWREGDSASLDMTSAPLHWFDTNGCAVRVSA